MNNKKFDNINIPTNINNSIEKGVKRALIEKQSKRYKLSKLVPKIVAASFVGTLFIGITNPAMAAKIPLIGNVFKSVESDLIYKGEFSKYSTTINKSVYSNGVNITLSEIACDGISLYATYIVENDNKFKYASLNSKQLGMDETYNKVDFSNTELCTDGFWGLEGKFVNERKFIGIQKYDMTPIKENIPDEFNFQTKISYLENSSEGNAEPDSIKGTWEFNIPIKVNKNLRKVINVDNLNNEYLDSISLSVSPFDMTLTTSYKNGVWDDYRAIIYDENGNELNDSREIPFHNNKKSVKYLESPGNNKNIRIKIIKQELVEIESKPGSYDVNILGVVFDETISLEK